MTPFTTRDAGDVADILREVAAAAIMPRWRRLAPDEVREKAGPLDLVTAADEAAERAIVARLIARFPGCVVVGEEGSGDDGAAACARLADAALAFTVDPIDGTLNFAAGLPLFGVMAAAVVHGEVVAAVIHDPVGDDTALAVRGEGAWLHDARGESDLRVAPPVPVAEMTGAAGWRHLPQPARGVVAGNLPRVAFAFNLRCAAHEYRMLAAGHCHFLLFNRLMPWDHAPGWLLHREAGGYAAHFDGSDYRPTRSDGGLLCAPDRDSWLALRSALLEA